MTDQELISKILLAIKLEDILDVSNLKDEYKAIAAQIHPDKCTLVEASKAMSILNYFMDENEKGKKYHDDLGEFRTNGYWVEYPHSDVKNFAWSLENYRLLMDLKHEDDLFFQKYMPQAAKVASDGTVRFEFGKRAIPISGLVLAQEHVNWILNRLIEFSSFMAQRGFQHCGFTPESIFIVPETHGIQVCSFYHLSRVGAKGGTVSGRYYNWYPQRLLDTRIVDTSIDVEMSKRIAAYLLGDTSGMGNKFKKTHNEDFINFLTSCHNHPVKALHDYKAMLRKNFEKKFHSLTI